MYYHLVELLFGRQKRRAEMESDKSKLSFLKKQTKNDYEIYQNEFLNGRLVYFTKADKWNKMTAKRLGFTNIDLLKERLSLENKFNLLDGEILMLKGLITKTKNTKDNTPVLKETESTKSHQMHFETENTDALVYEINNFHLKWEKDIKEDIAKKYNKSEFALYYNGFNMWEVYDAGSIGVNYENKMLSLYKECINEIDKNSLNLKREDRIPYLKKILPKFYTNEPNKEQVTFLSIQEQEIQETIYSYHTGHDFMAEGGTHISDFITICVSGFDSKEFEFYSYHCLNQKEETYLEDLSDEDNEYWNIRHSFVKTILSIKRNTLEKLEQQINKWIELEGNNDKGIATPPTKEKEEKAMEVLNTFDYSNLTEIFFPDKIEDFKRIENEMLNSDFFKNNKWSDKHPKYELAGLIHILNSKKYFKPLKGKNTSTSLLSYRYFFEKRYGIIIEKEFQSNRINKKLHFAKVAFTSINI